MPSAHPPSPPSSVDPPGNTHELRDEQRRRVDHLPHGRITLLAHSERQRVQLIRDVSAHGVSLVLEHALEPGEPVLIEQTPEPGHPVDRALSGAGALATPPAEPQDEACVYRAYVVWCRDFEAANAAPDAHFVAGLRVYGPQSLERLILPAARA
jgi:hypothetical protein